MVSVLWSVLDWPLFLHSGPIQLRHRRSSPNYRWMTDCWALLQMNRQHRLEEAEEELAAGWFGGCLLVVVPLFGVPGGFDGYYLPVV